MRCFGDILIFVDVDGVSKHFKVKCFMDILWILDDIIVAKLAALQTLCVDKSTKYYHDLFLFKKFSVAQGLRKA